jgi:hypothetical protein
MSHNDTNETGWDFDYIPRVRGLGIVRRRPQADKTEMYRVPLWESPTPWATWVLTGTSVALDSPILYPDREVVATRMTKAVCYDLESSTCRGISLPIFASCCLRYLLALRQSQLPARQN